MKTRHYTALCIACLLLISGCIRTGRPFQRVTLPDGAPVPGKILAELSRNDAAITSFKAKGAIVFQRPGVRKKDVLPQSELIFQRPDALFLKGNKLAHNVMNLTCIGDEFLLVLPLEKMMVYQETGATVAEMGESISPMDILQEAFLPEAWAKLHPKQVRMTAFDPDETWSKSGLD